MPIASSLAAGTHTVAVTYINDASGLPVAGSTASDRNLFLNDATYNGNVIQGSSVNMFSNGTATFSVTVKGATPTLTPSTMAITGIPYTGIRLSGVSEPGSIVTVSDTADNTTTVLGTTMWGSSNWNFTAISGLGRIYLSTIHHYNVAAWDSSDNSGISLGGLYLTDTGNDVLSATPGLSEVFAIMSNLGTDVINGFETSKGVGASHDYIDFSGRGLSSFGQLQSIISGSTSTVFTLSGGKTVTLTNVAPSMLSAADFRFS